MNTQCKLHCGVEVNEEWKMNAHMKQHEKKCNECDLSFKYQGILEKHLKISHEKLKIYCHFYKNHKSCPYGEKCVFLHEDSDNCKYGTMCERIFFMYKHGC